LIIVAKLREAKAYRTVKRAYTRKSKFRRKSYIKGSPASRIAMFDMGNKSKKFPKEVSLVAKKPITIRHNAIEAARMTANRFLALSFGKQGYGMKIRAVPHQILRVNPLATGAGADRIQQGMRSSYGKAESVACRVHKGKILITAYVPETGIAAAKEALRKASCKFAIPCSIQVK